MVVIRHVNSSLAVVWQLSVSDLVWRFGLAIWSGDLKSAGSYPETTSSKPSMQGRYRRLERSSERAVTSLRCAKNRAVAAR